MRIVFMGSPDFAVPTLEALASHYEVAGVVTQPDRPAGRGRRVKSPPIRLTAHRLGLSTIQPARISDPKALEAIQAWAPDLIVVAAFGQLLRPALLDLPQMGCLNVHASLLPRWRGASPIQAAILAGDPISGVSLMRMDPGLDTGPVLAQREVLLAPDETGETLSTRLSHVGASLVLETLPGYIRASLTPTPQDDSLATYAPLLRKRDGLLQPTESTALLVRKVRAFHPWPGTFLNTSAGALRVLSAHAAPAPSPQPPGTLLVAGNLPAMTTIDGMLVLDRVQPVGRKSMSGAAFVRGARDFAGQTLSGLTPGT